MIVAALGLQSGSSRLIFGKNYDSRGFPVQSSYRADDDLFFFGTEVPGNLIGKTVTIMTAGRMGDKSGRLVYRQQILVFKLIFQRRQSSLWRGGQMPGA